jgi:hypothetical protein
MLGQGGCVRPKWRSAPSLWLALGKADALGLNGAPRHPCG